MRRTGLTFAPEGGTWRIRQVINKLITDDDLYAAVEGAYSQGWQRVKLYFLIGVPTEMDEDTLGIAELAREVVEDRAQVHEEGELHRVGRRLRAEGAHAVPVVRSERCRRAAAQGRAAARRPAKRSGATIRWHDPAATFAEGIASRGDRRIGRVIERVWRAGGTFQEWSERFELDRWLDAMAAEGLDADWYVTRHRTDDEILPVGPHRRRAAPRLPLGRLAGGARRARPPRLPVDAVLRLRGVHRLRPRARRGVARCRRPAGSQGTGQDLDFGGEAPRARSRVPVASGSSR